MQTAGDCHTNRCDGTGNIVNAVDNSDIPFDNNACTSDLCTAGAASNPPVALNTPCGTGQTCDGKGVCTGCMNATTCPGVDTACAKRTCIQLRCGFTNAAAGTQCVKSDGFEVCDGAGACVQCVTNANCTGGRSCINNVCVQLQTPG